MADRPRVAIVFGGTSSEHAISCLTAAAVTQVLDPQRYDLVGVGIAADGSWVRFDAETMARLQVEGRRLPAVTAGPSDGIPAQATDGADAERSVTERLPVRGGGAAGRDVLLPELASADVALALLHGPYGEDGTIQGLFEMLGLRYVGSGVMASAAGMDKQYMKHLLTAAGIPVGPFVAIAAREWETDREACLEAVRALEFPVYVKPARGGSSLGISKVTEDDDLTAAIEFARRYDPKVVVEQGFVGARELECGVLEVDGELRASVVGEIRMHTASGFYDFDAKYLPEEQVDLDVPAVIDDDLAEQVRAMSIAVFRALGCEGLARVDFFLGRDHRLYCNEINTMPGFTSLSMFPRLWAAAGIDYPELVDTLLRSALTRRIGLR